MGSSYAEDCDGVCFVFSNYNQAYVCEILESYLQCMQSNGVIMGPKVESLPKI